MKQKGKIFILSGPSGSGKTTLYKRLIRDHRELVKTVSVTTRPRRPGEVHGRDYFFVSLKMFEYKKRAGHFLEHQKVFDHYYGTPKKLVCDLLARGANVLLCIDVKGASVVQRKFRKAVRIFVKTPNLAILKERLTNRGTDDPQTIAQRMETAKQELKEAAEYQYVVINDDLDHAYGKLESVLAKEVRG